MATLNREHSKTSSDGGSPMKEEKFVDALLTQVDESNVNDIIQLQKKSLERFEKTNEMLSNCVTLSEKRLEKAKNDIFANKELLLNAKTDLETIFRKLRSMKQILAQKYPEIYKEIAAEFKPPVEDES